MVIRRRTIQGGEQQEVHFSISSLPLGVQRLARAVRSHQSIDNRLHWLLDVNFTQDASRIRKGHSPEIASMLRQLALMILQRDTRLSGSLRCKRKPAGWNNDALETLLTHFQATEFEFRTFWSEFQALKKVMRLRVGRGIPMDWSSKERPSDKEAAHGSYTPLSRIAMRVSDSLYRTHLSGLLRLMTGWVLSHRRRFVTDLIWSSGALHAGHFCRYHRFFSQASWELDAMSQVLATLVIRVLVPTGVIVLAVDDTLCRKRGLTVYGTGMHHDPLISSRAKPLTSWGHDWVVVTLILRNPFWSPGKVWSLPLVFCLYRNWQGVTKGKAKGLAKLSPPERAQRKRQEAKQRAADPNHRTRPQLAVQAISRLAEWFPHRQFLVTGDSASGGKSVLSKRPAHVDLISHVHCDGALYEPAPPPAATQRGLGRPRQKGPRLPGLTAWADDAAQPWQTLRFREYGLHATLLVKFRKKVLYYKSGGTRRVNVVLTRDRDGHRPDQMFYCTRLDWTPRQILSCDAGRWSIEVCFENAKQLLGLEDPANRVPKAVARTAPISLVLSSLCLLWFHQSGHRLVKYPERPWYKHKTTPSFADILCTLRRESFLDWFSRVPCPDNRVKKRVAHLVDLLSLSG